MKKTILFLEHCTDNTIGGSHYCLLEICRKLDKQKFNIIAAFYQDNSLTDSFREAGVQVELLKPHRSFTLAGRVPRIVDRIIRLPVNIFKMFISRTLYWKSIIKKFNVDIVHLNNTFTTDHDVIFASLLTRTPCIAHVRGIQHHIDKFSRFLSKHVFAIVSISMAVKENLVRNQIPDSKIRLIFDGIDPQRINNNVSDIDIRKQWNIPAESRVVGIVGNVKEWKGQEVVVDAMLELSDKYPDLYCLIIGSISDEAYHQRLLGKLRAKHIEDRVLFVGYQKNVADYLNTFDVFIHASIDPEPFGIVILEAMALNKPVIASNIGAPKEIIEEGVSGMLFQSGDSVDLARVIDSFLIDESMGNVMGSNGFKRLHAKFTSSKNVDGLNVIYDEAISHGK